MAFSRSAMSLVGRRKRESMPVLLRDAAAVVVRESLQLVMTVCYCDGVGATLKKLNHDGVDPFTLALVGVAKNDGPINNR
mmetsp:Transcript_46552/g.98797  ORF Transcript_46552/g.98797 Transcript_46552/m.98797 type:complete len:80 (-) Transcript_46552:13-252(-)